MARLCGVPGRGGGAWQPYPQDIPVFDAQRPEIGRDAFSRQVRVVAPGQTLTCEKRGEIGVSVKDHLGPLERNDLKVRDELEVLARNEAPGLGADTVQPVSEPMDGEQRWAAFRCGGAVGTAPATTGTRVEALPEDEAEVTPLRED